MLEIMLFVTYALYAATAFGCQDIMKPNGEVWTDVNSRTCAQYESDGLCSNGEIVNKLFRDFGAEEYCCACGKG